MSTFNVHNIHTWWMNLSESLLDDDDDDEWMCLFVSLFLINNNNNHLNRNVTRVICLRISILVCISVLVFPTQTHSHSYTKRYSRADTTGCPLRFDPFLSISFYALQNTHLNAHLNTFRTKICSPPPPNIIHKNHISALDKIFPNIFFYHVIVWCFFFLQITLTNAPNAHTNINHTIYSQTGVQCKIRFAPQLGGVISTNQAHAHSKLTRTLF